MIETHERFFETYEDLLFEQFRMRVDSECGEETRKYTPLELARLAFSEGRKLTNYAEAAGAWREGCFCGVAGSLIIAGGLAALYAWLRG